LFVSATWIAGQPRPRLVLTGQVDQVSTPRFGKRARQLKGKWWKAEDGRKAFDVVAHEAGISPQVLMWQPATRRLWAGGDFNVADGKPRNRLARVAGGNQ
jgi:hypothetical protein